MTICFLYRSRVSHDYLTMKIETSLKWSHWTTWPNYLNLAHFGQMTVERFTFYFVRASVKYLFFLATCRPPPPPPPPHDWFMCDICPLLYFSVFFCLYYTMWACIEEKDFVSILYHVGMHWGKGFVSILYHVGMHWGKGFCVYTIPCGYALRKRV